MSENGVVVVIGLIGFMAGLAIAVRLFPRPGALRSGDLVLWVGRLVSGAAVGACALDVYSVVERQSGEDSATDPIDLADGLARALFDFGVLFSLAVGLAVVGSLLLARDEG